MPKHKNPMLAALAAGQSYTWTEPAGGDLASMRAAIKHGQTLTLSPVTDPSEIRVGDLVLVQWHQSHIFHLVGEIQDGRFLIMNSLGKINGWVAGSTILGRVTHIIDPEPRPDVPAMLEELAAAYQQCLQREPPSEADARRLLAIVDDLRWHAERLGAKRWDTLPRSNKWSFAQQLWHLVQQAKTVPAASSPAHIADLIGQGHECLGAAAEIVRLLGPAD